MSSSSPPTVALPELLRRRAVDAARAALPNEACGLLVAEEPTDWSAATLRVVDLVPIANSLASPSSFALEGQAMLDAEIRIDAAGRHTIGVYHSHPTSEARPSPTDVADAVGYDPDHVLVHLLASLQGFAPTVRAWRFGPTVAECVELPILEHTTV